MFHHEGPSRSPRTNAIVAGYLAFIGGFVNSGGFITVGAFTSHVTGSVGRIGTHLATGDPGAAVLALSLVLSFFVGSVGATLIIEGHAPKAVSRAYGRALLVEAALLALFVVTQARRDVACAVLCAAMGMQNSLVTRLSGAVIRTTHLTGVVTDLGIEAARWLRWQQTRRERPQRSRIALLAVIVATFVAGAVAGGTLTARFDRHAMGLPAVGVAAAAALALRRPRLEPP
ncbi:MAG: DUF1275 domain-containing protein [Myxococcaceae bacterium]|nr:DUF1275 domain-containing protein [Myxococcaceae bacterium]